MTTAVDKLNITLDILYKRIEFINKYHEDKEMTNSWRDTRNYFVDQILIIKRQRARLLGVIKE